jgi:hypothetical protein
MHCDNLYRPCIENERVEGDTPRISCEGAVKSWLQQWLPGNVDVSPMLPGKMHLDAPSKKFVYEIMKEEWMVMQRHVPHYSAFIKVLRANFTLVIHKHKKFTECQVCALFKQLWAKSRMESCALRTEIKALRRAHLERQYNERVSYYAAREQSYNQPDDYLCIIIDGMTATSTSVPMMRREAKGFDTPTYQTQLYGAHVHGPEGFFGYTLCGIKGARVTVEVLHRTLLKLARTRKVWPKFFRLQLDNTTGDCKNHTVAAYMAWLEATGVFEVTTVAFLAVGHTHEDIDGYFGMLRRYLMRLEAGVMTIPALHQAIQDCFHKVHNEWLDKDADLEGMRDKHWKAHFDVEEMAERVKVEHIWTTYDWDKFFVGHTHPNGRAFVTLNYIAQLRDPDVYRPHFWEFSISGGVVVLNLKHWAADEELWNEAPLPVWNRVPELADLQPAPIVFPTSKVLVKMHGHLQRCEATFAATGRRCKDVIADGGTCPQCDAQTRSKCTCATCARCSHMALMETYMSFRGAINVSPADVNTWEAHFDNLTQQGVDATLLPLSQMALPKCARVMGHLPSVQEQVDNLPTCMRQAPVGLKCRVKVMGMGPKAFRNLCAKAGSLPGVDEDEATVDPLAAGIVVAGRRSTTGKLEFALTLPNGSGSWVTFKQLRAHEDKIAATGADCRAAWFGACVQFDTVIVQEQNKRTYSAQMHSYDHEKQCWTLTFAKQKDNVVMGTSACDAETQMLDLEELHFFRETNAQNPKVPPSQTVSKIALNKGKTTLVMCPPCSVVVNCPRTPRSRCHTQTSQGHHLFWCSRAHYGLDFIQQKLQGQLGHVKNQAIDTDQLKRLLLHILLELKMCVAGHSKRRNWHNSRKRTCLSSFPTPAAQTRAPCHNHYWTS